MSANKLRFKIGIALISISIVVFLFLFSIPFFSFGAKIKITLGTVCIIAGEVLFWGGTLLIGKEVYQKFMVLLKSGEWLNRKK